MSINYDIIFGDSINSGLTQHKSCQLTHRPPPSIQILLLPFSPMLLSLLHPRVRTLLSHVPWYKTRNLDLLSGKDVDR